MTRDVYGLCQDEDKDRDIQYSNKMCISKKFHHRAADLLIVYYVKEQETAEECMGVTLQNYQ